MSCSSPKTSLLIYMPCVLPCPTFFMPYVSSCLTGLVPYIPRALHALASHVPRVLRAPVPRVLRSSRSLVPYVPRALRASWHTYSSWSRALRASWHTYSRASCASSITCLLPYVSRGKRALVSHVSYLPLHLTALSLACPLSASNSTCSVVPCPSIASSVSSLTCFHVSLVLLLIQLS